MSSAPYILDKSLAQLHARIEDAGQTPYAKLIVGAAVISEKGDSARSTILLVERAPSEVCYPYHFEIPGGKVVDMDTTIFNTLAREYFEETGLSIERRDQVICQPISFEYVTKKVKGSDGKEEIISKGALQLNFVVQTRSIDEIKLNPEKHSECKWAAAVEVGVVMTTDETGEHVWEMMARVRSTAA